MLEEDIIADAFPISDDNNIKMQEATYHLFESSGIGIGYTNLTGRFPYRSSRGNKCILVAYHYDANIIFPEPVNNRQVATLTSAWNTINNKFKAAGM